MRIRLFHKLCSLYDKSGRSIMNRLAAFVTITIALLAGTAVSAYADDGYLNEALQALQTGNVYVSPSVPGVDAKAIQTAIGSQDIAVVVLPADAATAHGGASGFVQELGTQANHKTVVVVIGNDFDAGSSMLPKGEASRIANEAEGHSGDLTARIVDAVNGIASKQATTTTTTTTTIQPQDNGPSPVFGFLGWGSLVLVFVVLSWLAVRWRQKMAANEPPAVKFVNAPTNVRNKVREVLEMRSRIKTDSDALRNAGVSGGDLITALTNIGRYVEAYFRRAKPEADGTYKAADDIATYVTKLQGVLEGFIAVQDEPEFYYEADAKLNERAKAIGSCANYMLTQVRTVNEAQDFDLASAVKVLAASELRSIRA